MSKPADVLVYGDDAAGLMAAAALASSGLAVHCIAGSQALAALRRQGLRLLRADGRALHLAPGVVGASAQLADAPAASLALVTARSHLAHQIGTELGGWLAPESSVLCLQGGVDAPERMRASAPQLRVLPALGELQAESVEPGVVRQVGDAALRCPRDPALEPWSAQFANAGLPLVWEADVRGRQWGRLLSQLAGPLCELCELPRDALLGRREFRALLAGLHAEALRLMRRAAIRPRSVGALPPTLVPWVLRLPDRGFRWFARAFATDPQVLAGQPGADCGALAERVDELCGAVVRLAESLGEDAPLHRRMVELVASGDVASSADTRLQRLQATLYARA